MNGFEVQSLKDAHESQDKSVKHVGMISYHGYFAAEPQLGKTDTGGQVVFVLELSKYLHEVSNIKITIFTRLFHEEESPIHSRVIERVSEGVDIIRIPDPMSENGFIRKEDLYPYLPEAGENIVRWIKENSKVDIIHSHYVDGGILGEYVSNKLKIPWVHNSHSLGRVKRDALLKKVTDQKEIEKLDNELNFVLRFKSEEMIYDKCLLIYAESLDEKNNLLKFYGQEYNDKVVIIPPGVNTDEWHPKNVDRSKHPLNRLFDVENYKYIFSVSRLDPRKGLDLLIEAAPILKTKIHDENLKIVIGGGSKKGRKLKPYEQSLHDLASKIDPNREFIYLTGYIPDEEILDYYNACELFVLPARWELFGITMLEAMACMKPVVVTKFGGPATIINDGVNGALVDPTNKEELATKIVELLNNKDRANKIAKNALKTITEKFSWRKIAEEYYSKYIKVINSYCKRGF
ncbi:MAG: glycosyltransferase [Candidatus Helarchaeota archaeon]